MQAIITKFHPATDTKGARISATCNGGKVYISYPHECSEGEQVHKQAAIALCNKMNWKGELVAGCLPDGKGYAFVFLN